MPAQNTGGAYKRDWDPEWYKDIYQKKKVTKRLF